MAIKVGGTTVIDDSRNLVNIVSGAGVSTTWGAIDTYAFLAFEGAGSHVAPGGTLAGSSLHPAASDSYDPNVTMSGTWRAMGFGNKYRRLLWIRIS